MSTIREVCDKTIEDVTYMLRVIAWDHGIRHAKLVQAELVRSIESIDLTEEPTSGTKLDEQGEIGDEG